MWPFIPGFFLARCAQEAFQEGEGGSCKALECQGLHYQSTWLGHGVSWELVKHYFWLCLGGCFWVRPAFELVNWVEQMALPDVRGLVWSTEDLNRTKVEGVWFCLSAWRPSWDLSLQPLDWNDPTGVPASQASRLRLELALLVLLVLWFPDADCRLSGSWASEFGLEIHHRLPWVSSL